MLRKLGNLLLDVAFLPFGLFAVWTLDLLYGDLIRGAAEVAGCYTPTAEERKRRRKRGEG